jgi:outer membrane lipoprotein SlyB
LKSYFDRLMDRTRKMRQNWRNTMKKALALLMTAAMGFAIAGCASTGSTVNTKKGAVLGTVIGAAAGGIIGHQSGRGLEGAAIGAGVGAVGGGVVGSAKDEAEGDY